MDPHLRMRLAKQLMAEQFDRETPQDYPVSERSSLLPLATYENGKTGLAWPGFIAEDIPNAFTAPARALRGELPNYLDDRDAYIREGLNVAGTAAVGGSAVPRSVGVSRVAKGLSHDAHVRTYDDDLLLPKSLPPSHQQITSPMTVYHGNSRNTTLPGTLISEAAEQQNRISNPIRAYHGSPHDFDNFDLSKIGTGEGAQAFGHGLYFAENPEVAKSYQTSVQVATQVQPWQAAATQALNTSKSPQAAVEFLRENARFLQKRGTPEFRQAATDIYERAAREIEGGHSNSRGRLYEVNIHASPDDFLDWDKPLSQQSEKAKSVFYGMLNPDKLPAHVTPEDVYGHIKPQSAMGHLASAMGLHPASMEAKTGIPNALAERGIPGIRYLDQGSRTAGEGSRNLVVFDPSIIEILRKYGLLGTLGGASAYGAFNEPGQESIGRALQQ